MKKFTPEDAARINATLNRTVHKPTPFTPTQLRPVRAKYDLTGRTFGRWKVIKFTGRMLDSKTGQHQGISLWQCRCVCGQVKDEVLYSSLVQGHSESCGCLRRDLISRDPSLPVPLYVREPDLYAIWLGIKTRCLNQSHPTYKRYGGRGITICDRWVNNFEAFAHDMGPRPPGYQVERINNDGNYGPENCRWIPREQQATNTRRNLRFDWKGRIRILTDIAIMENVAYNSLRNKIVIDGYTVEEAIGYCRSRDLEYRERAACRGGSRSPRPGWERRKKSIASES